MADSGLHSESGGLFGLFLEIIRSPVNIALVGVISLLIYKIVKSRQKVVPEPYPKEPEPMRKRDFTVEGLKKYDGTGPDGRILVAVNGKVFDVTRRGRQFYGPGIVKWRI
jgi:membrane-associated progesterone receptor component